MSRKSPGIPIRSAIQRTRQTSSSNSSDSNDSNEAEFIVGAPPSTHAQPQLDSPFFSDETAVKEDDEAREELLNSPRDDDFPEEIFFLSLEEEPVLPDAVPTPPRIPTSSFWATRRKEEQQRQAQPNNSQPQQTPMEFTAELVNTPLSSLELLQRSIEKKLSQKEDLTKEREILINKFIARTNHPPDSVRKFFKETYNTIVRNSNIQECLLDDWLQKYTGLFMVIPELTLKDAAKDVLKDAKQDVEALLIRFLNVESSLEEITLEIALKIDKLNRKLGRYETTALNLEY